MTNITRNNGVIARVTFFLKGDWVEPMIEWYTAFLVLLTERA